MLKIILCFIFSLQAHSFVILIDPGHGGEDDGASSSFHGHTILEKDIALELSKKIHRLLSKNHSSYLTRSLDRSIGLKERADLAEKMRANLFISVHVNASTRASSSGIETYYLDNHQDAVITKLEKIENKSLSGKDYVIDKILTDIVIRKTTKSSKKLAGLIHQKINKYVARPFKMKNRGIRPGMFHVLTLAKRPAVLLEMGFLSNPKEREKILSEKFQEAYAKSVVEGIEEYIKSLKK